MRWAEHFSPRPPTDLQHAVHERKPGGPVEPGEVLEPEEQQHALHRRRHGQQAGCRRRAGQVGGGNEDLRWQAAVPDSTAARANKTASPLYGTCLQF